ncbi:MAG: ParB/RepB/Spo0J family partition protein [Chloroflexia bacterium]
MSKSRVPARAWAGLINAAPEEGVQPLKDAKRIDIDLVHTDPRQPRKHFDQEAMDELTASVRERGILQPITVQKRDEGGYLVVTGERRLRAARAAGLDSVPALVVDLSDTDRRLDRVIENRQRKDLTDLEFARAIIEIRADLAAGAAHLSSNELDELVGRRLGLSGRTVRNFAALLNLDPAIEDLLGEQLTELRTRGLARVAYDREMQIALARAILEHDLSGRQTLAVAQLLKRSLGLTVVEAVDRVLAGEPAKPQSAVGAGLRPADTGTPPALQPDADALLDPNDPQRRYHLLTTYLARAAALLAEAGADEEVPLDRRQVSDLGLLLDPLLRLHEAIRPALVYIAEQEARGEEGYEGEPLPRKLAPMLPYEPSAVSHRQLGRPGRTRRAAHDAKAER